MFWKEAPAFRSFVRRLRSFVRLVGVRKFARRHHYYMCAGAAFHTRRSRTLGRNCYLESWCILSATTADDAAPMIMMKHLPARHIFKSRLVYSTDRHFMELKQKGIALHGIAPCHWHVSMHLHATLKDPKGFENKTGWRRLQFLSARPHRQRNHGSARMVS